MAAWPSARRWSAAACGSGGRRSQTWRSHVGALPEQLRLQATNTLHLPYEVFLMLPFVLTIVAMALVSRNARAPASLVIPFRKEER